MSISLILLLVVTLVRLAIFAFVIYAAVQGVKALRKYNRSGEVRKEKAETRRSACRKSLFAPLSNFSELYKSS